MSNYKSGIKNNRQSFSVCNGEVIYFFSTSINVTTCLLDQKKCNLENRTWERIYAPERTGCTLFIMIDVASNGVSAITSCFTSSLLVNADGYWFLVMIKTKERRTPIKNELMTTTTTENFAVLGWPAPSSFDTLTLQSRTKKNGSFLLLILLDSEIEVRF